MSCNRETLLLRIIAVEGLKPAIEGMRNPMNSHEKSDTTFTNEYWTWRVSYHDRDLAKRLIKGGPEQSKFRRMIVVWMDILGPLYWWKEFDTYKVGTVASSESTRHRIVERPFTRDDFANKQLITVNEVYHDPKLSRMIRPGNHIPELILSDTIACMNQIRKRYLEEEDPELKERLWLNIWQLMPQSFLQRRTVMMNYETLANVYRQRRNHRLPEWQDFCAFIASALPESWIFTYDVGKEQEKED